MKKYLTILLSILLLISCSKDEDIEVEESNSKRPHITSYYKNGLLESKLEYVYNNNQLVEIIDITPVQEGSMHLSYKYEFDYKMPVVSLNLFVGYTEELTHFFRLDYIYSNSKLSQLDLSRAPEFEQVTESQFYTYSNNQLVLIESKTDFGSGMELRDKIDYEYDDSQRIKRCNYYEHSDLEGWWIHRFQSYTYNTNQVEVSTIREIDSLYFDKVVNNFEGEKLTHTEFYGRNFDDELEFTKEIFFDYDEEGYLIEERKKEGVNTFVTEIEYEPGKDNLDLFSNPESEIYEFSNPFGFQFDKSDK